MHRFSASSAVAILVVAAIPGFSVRPCRAAIDSGISFGQVAQAWMGAVALLAHDEDHDHRDRHHAGKRDGHGPRPGTEGPRALMAKLDDIVDRLSRIEAKLDRRAGGPPRGEWRGPRPEGGPGPRPERRAEVPEEVRDQMRRRMEGAQAEMRKRMDEGRERMEQARRKFREMEERIGKLEAEIERLKAER